MKLGSLLLLVLALILTSVCHARRLRRATSVKMLRNLNHITRQLRELTTSLGEYDEELRRALSADGVDGRLHKRSTDNDEFLSELRRQRRLVQLMKNIFDDTQHTLDRQKKWSTCNLNLGFTCQTEEYNEIANYFDYLNSANSPGKKRSAPEVLVGVP